jgi:hypothetical protein
MPTTVKLYVDVANDKFDHVRDLITTGAAAKMIDAEALEVTRRDNIRWGLDFLGSGRAGAEELGELTNEGSEYMTAVEDHASSHKHKVVGIELMTNRLGCENVVITLRQEAYFKFFKVSGVNSGGERMASARQHQCANIKRVLGENKFPLMHLIREPNNPYDSHAIKVIYDYNTVKGEHKCFHLGYVNRATAQWLSVIMDHNVFVAVAGTDIRGGDSGYLYGAALRFRI